MHRGDAEGSASIKRNPPSTSARWKEEEPRERPEVRRTERRSSEGPEDGRAMGRPDSIESCLDHLRRLALLEEEPRKGEAASRHGMKAWP